MAPPPDPARASNCGSGPWPPPGLCFTTRRSRANASTRSCTSPGSPAAQGRRDDPGPGSPATADERLDEFDAVLVYREAALLGPALLERWGGAPGTADHLSARRSFYVPYRSPSNGYLSYLKCFGKVKSIIKLSTVVIVNSPQHRAFAAPLNENLWEIPSVVDGTSFNVSPPVPANGRPVCVGWSGSSSTSGNLQLIRGVLREVGDRSDARLRFIGGTKLDLPEVAHVDAPWRAATEVEDLRRFDVGLVPLPTTEWTKRKFYLKLIQYMALGIPPIATPLGANPCVIDHGRNGFLASSESDWRETIGRLIADPDLRATVGAAAAADARSKYTISANAEKIVAAFRSAVH